MVVNNGQKAVFSECYDASLTVDLWPFGCKLSLLHHLILLDIFLWNVVIISQNTLELWPKTFVLISSFLNPSELSYQIWSHFFSTYSSWDRPQPPCNPDLVIFKAFVTPLSKLCEFLNSALTNFHKLFLDYVVRHTNLELWASTFLVMSLEMLKCWPANSNQFTSSGTLWRHFLDYFERCANSWVSEPKTFGVTLKQMFKNSHTYNKCCTQSPHNNEFIINICQHLRQIWRNLSWSWRDTKVTRMIPAAWKFNAGDIKMWPEHWTFQTFVWETEISLWAILPIGLQPHQRAWGCLHSQGLSI